MKWRIPAKTFLLGEYAAVAGGSAIILTTAPCFELAIATDSLMHGIHPDSPAGQWWLHHRTPMQGLLWRDPYEGKGGLGASSAQFIGAYLASCHLLHIKPNMDALLDTYYQFAWRGEGLRPSGYDVLAQLQNRCVYINRQNNSIESYDWGFKDIAFLLLHSGQKLATHYHLQRTTLPNSINELSAISEQAKRAFEQTNSNELVDAINNYQQHLNNCNLIAPHSLRHIQALKMQEDVLAAKGCGALGADVLLLVVPKMGLKTKISNLTADGWTILASSDDLYTGRALMKNKRQKTLEILP
ncbi:mevalonate kinase family protein [Legionella hackeliae]|uniref:Mevalonate kinase n=1 Tax=Legionella hackeliae TaxID=449 RepID=A0A0A8UX52_LEGHA|nr:hypothetical protein [Legionella hackeliae]KTD10030.1 hypothetical protein Lhac_2398 [Legionella hackeliae]CEK11667.1 conserved protein of unknown function [Legionella hackeliae]STX48435.1 mevalonate kinase [Legionella hackeliae]